MVTVVRFGTTARVLTGIRHHVYGRRGHVEGTPSLVTPASCFVTDTPGLGGWPLPLALIQVIPVSAADVRTHGALACGNWSSGEAGVRNPEFFPKILGNFQHFSTDLHCTVGP